MQITNCRTLAISNSASGDTTIITAAGKSSQPSIGGSGVGDITVWGWILEGAGAVNIQFKSGTTAVGGLIVLNAAGATSTVIPSGVPYVKCAAGQDLVMNLSGAVAVTGTLYWTFG